MAIGIVSKEDLLKEQEKLNKKLVNLPVKIEEKPYAGRGIGSKEVDDKVREFLSELSLEGIATKEIKESFDISQSSISAYKNGSTSTASYHNREAKLVNSNRRVKDKISERASEVALEALDELMSGERIKNSRTRDIATIARSVSAIIKDMEPQKENTPLNDNRVQFIMMAPQMRTEEHYDIIDVSQNEL